MTMLLWESVLAAGVAGIMLYFGMPWAYGQWNRRVLRHLAVERKHVVLTLDDGPGRELTTAVLQLLAARGVKATFFLLGRNIRGNEDLVRQIRAQGHEIGSHTFDHLHAWKVAPWRSVSDIRRGLQAIDDALGTRTGRYPFRPPYGKLNLMTLLYLLARRIPIVYWTVETGDTWFPRPGANHAAQICGAAGGGVVLAHDFDRERPEGVHSYVLDALRSMLDMAQERGLRSSTVSQFRGVRT